MSNEWTATWAGVAPKVATPGYSKFAGYCGLRKKTR